MKALQTNRYLVAVVAALGLIPIVLDSTIVTVVLTPIRTELNTDVSTAQWIVTGFILANAAVVAIGGYLANLFGRKRMFVFGVTLFTLGSMLCGISPSIGWLIVFRVIQGIGGGLVFPIGPALAFDAFPKEERARASALVGIPILLAPIFGPIAGGYLNDAFGWHSIFFINLPVGIIAVLAALLVIPPDTSSRAGASRFDYVGLALSTAGVIAVIYGLSLVTQRDPNTVTAANPNGSLYGWGYWLVWVLLAVGGVLLSAFAAYELRVSHDPALDLRQLGRYDFLMSGLIAWASALIGYGLLVLLPIYFEAVHFPALSALDTAIALIPFGVGSLAGTVAAAALYRALGPRWVTALGAALSGLSAWMLAQAIHPTANASQLLMAAQGHGSIAAIAGPDDLRWGLFFVGLSFTFINIPIQTLALEALKGETLAKASSLWLTLKLLFSSVGVAVITTIFVDRTQSRATDLVNQLRSLAHGSGISPTDPRVLQALHAIEAQIAVQAGTWAIQSIFWLIFFGSFVLLALALALPGRRRKLAESASANKQSKDEPEPVAAL